MRFIDIRLDARGSRRIGLRRALRRLAGLALSVLSLGLGFVGSSTRRRRGLPDRMAGTEVLYLAPSAARAYGLEAAPAEPR